MIDHAHLQATLAELRQRRVVACDRFLATALTDRAGFETSVRALFPAARSYLYVGTTPRGLAGSTSDVDVLVLLDGDAGQLPMPMIQHRDGRRIGIQTLGFEPLQTALTRLGAWAAANETPATGEMDALPVRWKLLERAVNGLSFDGDVPFIDAIAPLSEIAARAAAHRARACAVWLALALAAGRHGAARGYRSQLIDQARDGVLAVAGDVQSNAKWIGERWRIFLEAPKTPRLACLAGTVGEVEAIARGGDDAALPGAVPDLLLALSAAPDGRPALMIPPDVVRRPLTSEAEVLASASASAAMPSATLALLLSVRMPRIGELPAAAAATALDLASHRLMEAA